MAKRGYKLQEFVAHASAMKCLSIGKKTYRLLVTGGEDHRVNLWAIGKPTSLSKENKKNEMVDLIEVGEGIRANHASKRPRSFEKAHKVLIIGR